MGPLASLKILDFTTLLPGPFASMMLADLGADIIRIEAPNRPDLLRLMPPFDGEISSAHALLNRSKRSMTLNLKQPGATDVVKRLVQSYDIVLEQFRPGVMDRLGVGYETLKAVNPRLIYCSLTGYGQTGPYRDRAGHDINYLALSGLSSYLGRSGERLVPLPMQVADVGGGSLMLVVGLLSAVIQRQQTGEGQYVDVSMLDGSLAWNATGIAHTIVGGRSPEQERMGLNGGRFYDYYETSDGRYLSVGSLEPKFLQGLCQAIGLPDLFKAGMSLKADGQPGVKEAIQQEISKRSLAEWNAIFADYDVCVEPVLTTAEALDHPQAKARDMIVEVPKPDGTTQRQVGTPIKFSGSQPTYKHIGAAVGTHTKSVLEEAGFTADEIETLQAAGVFG